MNLRALRRIRAHKRHETRVHIAVPTIHLRLTHAIAIRHFWLSRLAADKPISNFCVRCPCTGCRTTMHHTIVHMYVHICITDSVILHLFLSVVHRHQSVHSKCAPKMPQCHVGQKLRQLYMYNKYYFRCTGESPTYSHWTIIIIFWLQFSYNRLQPKTFGQVI